MTLKAEMSIETLRKLVELNPETGELFWRARTPDLFALDSVQTPEHRCRNWNARFAGKPALHHIGGNGYRHGKIYYSTVNAHRVVVALVTGRWPKMVDHIDGDPLNNRPDNLREVDAIGNGRNLPKPRTNKSGVAGVFYRASKQRWVAAIRTGNGRREWIGEYKTFEQAVAARKDAERRHGYHPNHGRERASAV